MIPKTTKAARALRVNATEAEKTLWGILQEGQMGCKFRRQYPIDSYIVDFCCLEKKLIIEVDGGQHNESASDKKRDEELKNKGYEILRFWNNDVLENIEGVGYKIQEYLGFLPPLPPRTRVGKNAGDSRTRVGKNAENISDKISPRERGDKGGRASAPKAGRGRDSDVVDYRKDFPILNNTKTAYLDSASSAQKPQAVLDIMREVYENHYANIHRGLYEFSQKTTLAFEAVRPKVASFINASSPDEIIFTRNTTEAINLVAQSWGRTNLQKGDEIVITEMEHHANIVPWQLLATQIGVVIKVAPIHDDGTLDFGALVSLLSPKTKFVSVVHASNSLGTINPVAKIIRAVKDFNAGILTLVDGSQSVVHSSVDVQELGCDFFTFTGHKIYGPNGVGVLYGRSEILNAMPPYQGGGDMIETVGFGKGETTYKPAPARFEAGTPAIVEVIGLGAAIDYLQNIGMDNIAAHEAAMLDIMTQELSKIEGLTFYGIAPNKVGVVSFTADWAHTSDIAMILDQSGVSVRTGHHCCMPLMKRYGIDGTVRASIGLYTNEADIHALVKGLQKAKELLG